MKKLLQSIIILLFIIQTTSSAKQYFVSFESDRMPTYNLYGVFWTGIVDTTEDHLLIQTWRTEVGIANFWTLESLPLLCSAIDQNKNPYDVPDNWDGTTQANWGFVSTLSNYDLQWKEGQPDTFFKDIYMGWGGSIQLRDFCKDFYDTNGTRLYCVQESATGGMAVPPTRITFYEIPEPATLLLLGLGGLALRRKK